VPTDSSAAFRAPRLAEHHGARGHDRADAYTALTDLYQAHALSLTRLAHVMLGQRAAAEDVVQEAFCSLYLRWGKLSDQQKAPQYLRASVLNGCRTVLRRGRVRDRHDRDRHGTVAAPSATLSAESAVLATEEQRTVMQAIRRLPSRQREVLILRFYLEEPEAEIARIMGIRQGTVRSTTHRALVALGRELGITP
jgi:RNA polymerase sigma-70 factor (sigma-E family)